jgi:hypothetical protein
MNQAQRDGSIAEKSQAAAQKRLEAVGVELAAAKRGALLALAVQSLFAEVGAFA